MCQNLSNGYFKFQNFCSTTIRQNLSLRSNRATRVMSAPKKRRAGPALLSDELAATLPADEARAPSTQRTPAAVERRRRARLSRAQVRTLVHQDIHTSAYAFACACYIHTQSERENDALTTCHVSASGSRTSRSVASATPSARDSGTSLASGGEEAAVGRVVRLTAAAAHRSRRSGSRMPRCAC